MRQSGFKILAALLGIVFIGLMFWFSQGDSSPRNVEKSVSTATLRTSGAMPSTHRFVALGDWGAGTPFQKDIAAQLFALYQKAPYDTVLMLGDNIYPKGDVNTSGKAYFTDMYAPLIERGVQFIVALGNHDIAGGFQDDQVRFFKMPGYYYSVCKGPFEFFVINTNDFANNAIQQRWLDRALASSKAEWKIVMGHHPIYSSGLHGDNKGLIKTLEPILVRHSVPLYLAGHDHNYERFALIKGVQHLVSGGGGAYLRGFLNTAPSSLVRQKIHHFLSFTLEGDTLKMQAIDKTGQVFDTAQWTKPKALPKSDAAGVL
jgi:hypothetical protein